MLIGLTIHDVVLVDRLELTPLAGLGVLTGETGAGKSILLDALGLALGARADAALVRADAGQAMVAAEFAPPSRHPAWAILEEQGIVHEGTIVLRRVLGADGRSRAFINDQPVGVGLLKQLGDSLVEIQGQFDQRGLLDVATHRTLLDALGGHGEQLDAVAATWRRWRGTVAARERAEHDLAGARAEEEWLRHTVDELAALQPQEGEETALAEQRALLAGREKLIEGASTAAGEIAAAERALASAARQLERAGARAPGLLDKTLGAAERALVEAREAAAQLESATRSIDMDPRALEKVEERLYALRGLARKHNVAVDRLAELKRTLAERLAAIDSGDASMAQLRREEAAARNAYLECADGLSVQRLAAAAALDAAVARELPPLKLDKARFRTLVAPLDEQDWGEAGRERVRFEVATNPGALPGPLHKIASGGELARFLLALKVVLAKDQRLATLVFDEVDSGIGGAVAAAVGDRLQRLSKKVQVLVVTHSPQVAAKAAWHWRVAKEIRAGATLTRVEALDVKSRQEEIARMLAGTKVTAEARAAAASLMAGA
jgi:DNA repair protein RecN (Recombination protein N)